MLVSEAFDQLQSGKRPAEVTSWVANRIRSTKESAMWFQRQLLLKIEQKRLPLMVSADSDNNVLIERKE